MKKTKHKRLYDTRQWRTLCKMFKSRNPLCALCAQSGRITPGTTVDHIIPHNGDPVLFWDWNNLQTLCATCHSGTKKIKDLKGYSQAAGIDGLPLDENHPWNIQRGGLS